jgi:hypothetical protein
MNAITAPRTIVPRAGLAGASLLLIAIALVAVVIGSAGTWVTSDFVDVTANGLDKDGPILIALAAIVAIQIGVALTRGIKRPLWLLASCACAALSAVIGFADLGDVDANGQGLVEAGWGLQLATYASLALLAGSIAFTIAARRTAAE